MNELEFLQKPMEWPLWPLLPVKKRGGSFSDPQYCGLVHAAWPARVYHANLFAVLESGRGEKRQTWEETLASFKFKDYGSAKALLDEYQVD